MPSLLTGPVEPDAPRPTGYAPRLNVWLAIAAAGLLPAAALVSVPLALAERGTARPHLLALATLDVAMLAALLILGLQGVDPRSAGLAPEAYLGVQFEASAEGGVALRRVVPGAAAARAGLEEGDRLIAVGESSVGEDTLRSVLAEQDPARTVRVDFVRDGDESSLELQLDERPAPTGRSRAFHRWSPALVGAALFLGSLGLAALGARRGRPRWPGAGFVLLFGGFAATLIGSSLSADLGVAASAVLGALALGFSGLLTLRFRRAPVGLEPTAPVRIALGLGVVAAMGSALRGALWVWIVAGTLDVAPSPPTGVGEVLEAVEEADAGPLLVLALLVLWAPLTEELVFRGALLPWFASFMSPAASIGISAALFGGMHVSSHGLGMIVPMGFGAVLGWLRLRTGKLYPCILLHGLINLAVALAFLGR